MQFFNACRSVSGSCREMLFSISVTQAGQYGKTRKPELLFQKAD